MENINTRADGLNFEYIGWKYYNQIKKKAMEQKFSWSGLIISLSIAFFVVIVSSYSLNILYNTFSKTYGQDRFLQHKIYQLESLSDYSLDNYLQKDYISIEKIERVERVNLV